MDSFYIWTGLVFSFGAIVENCRQRIEAGREVRREEERRRLRAIEEDAAAWRDYRRQEILAGRAKID